MGISFTYGNCLVLALMVSSKMHTVGIWFSGVAGAKQLHLCILLPPLYIEEVCGRAPVTLCCMVVYVGLPLRTRLSV